MSVHRRLLFALLGIVAVLGVHLGVHLATARARAERYAELQQAIERQSWVASLERRWGALEQEIQLVAGVLADEPRGSVRRETRGRFATDLEAALTELRASELASPPAVLLEPATALAASWRRAFSLLEVEPVEAIAELSLRSAPLAD